MISRASKSLRLSSLTLVQAGNKEARRLGIVWRLSRVIVGWENGCGISLFIVSAIKSLKSNWSSLKRVRSSWTIARGKKTYLTSEEGLICERRYKFSRCLSKLVPIVVGDESIADGSLGKGLRRAWGWIFDRDVRGMMMVAEQTPRQAQTDTRDI